MRRRALKLLVLLVACLSVTRCQSNYESEQVNDDEMTARSSSANLNCVFVGCSCGEDDEPYASNEAEYMGGGGGGAVPDHGGSPYGQGYDVMCRIDENGAREFPERDTSRQYSNVISSIEV